MLCGIGKRSAVLFSDYPVLCSGDLDSMSETGVESTDGGDPVISPLNAQVLKKLDQKAVSHHSGESSDGYPAIDSAYINGKKFS